MQTLRLPILFLYSMFVIFVSIQIWRIKDTIYVNQNITNTSQVTGTLTRDIKLQHLSMTEYDQEFQCDIQMLSLWESETYKIFDLIEEDMSNKMTLWISKHKIDLTYITNDNLVIHFIILMTYSFYEHLRVFIAINSTTTTFKVNDFVSSKMISEKLKRLRLEKCNISNKWCAHTNLNILNCPIQKDNISSFLACN